MKYFWIGLLILLVLFPDAWHLPLQPTATPRDALTALQQAFDLAEDGQFTESGCSLSRRPTPGTP